MVGRVNHFKHTPGMGLAVLLLGVGALVGVPIALMLLVVVINAPWVVIPIGGVAYWIYSIRQKRIRAHDDAIIRQLNESSERFYRESEERRLEFESYLEESRRRDQEIVDWLEMRRRERK